jgi:hypothetical protein
MLANHMLITGKWTFGENRSDLVMSSIPKDYPDGFGRLLPGHTAEMEPGFAQPWLAEGSLAINVNANGTYTITFSDYAHIYFIDMITVTPQTVDDLTVFVYVNGQVYVAASQTGWIDIPLRQNPSIQFLADDTCAIKVYNVGAGNHTFLIKVNGTKIIRPDNFGHAPSAGFTVDDATPNVGQTVTFTNTTWYSIDNRLWDFGDGVILPIIMSPTHVYTKAGTYYPKLKEINTYGYDTYSLKVVVT